MPDISPPVTAVDLSRLPAPDTVEQLAYETIFASKVALVQAALAALEAPVAFDATVESDPAVKLLQRAAYDELLARQDFNDRLKRMMLAFATGSAIDHIAAPFGVTRLVITAADPGNGVEEVLEGDDAFKERILLAPESYTVAGTESSYIAAARRSSGDVLHASAISPEPDDIRNLVLDLLTANAAGPGLVAAMTAALDNAIWPGEVIVSVLSRTGDGSASAELLDDVRAIVNDGEVRPLTDLVTVQSADIVEFAITAQLRLFSGPDQDIVLAAAQTACAAYCDEVHRLGRRVVISAIIAALQVEGVEEVILASPADNIPIARTQASWCTGINLSVAA